jgi:hypothetical protein
MAQNAGLAVAGGVSPAILAYQQAVLVGSTITSAAIVKGRGLAPSSTRERR